MINLTNRFLELFYEISSIPRQSGKEEKFAKFLEEFAYKNNLEYYKDKSNNVLIKKCGNKNINDTLILQAHIDMVCVKKENSKHNFEIDPIKIIKNGDMIYAKDTSLGADQGIGIAIMLLILESNNIKHSNLECLFTTEEETTFNGAMTFDYTLLKGKKMINLDNCRDDSIVIGCDADICNKYILKGNLNITDLPTYEIIVKDVKGGNSGEEVERSNKNAIKIMAKIIQNLQKEDNILICSIVGGSSENDIATFCKCIIKTKINNLETKIRQINNREKIEIYKTINDFSFSLEDSQNIINEIINLKQGVIKTINNDIIVSGNIGTINTIKNEVIITGVLRSIKENELKNYNEENKKISKYNNFQVEEVYIDPVWKPNENSELKDKYKKIYYEVNGKYPNIEVTHGGLEVSSILERTENIDIISIGSNIQNFHTVDEKMYISSCEKTIKTLIAYLES